MRTATSVRINQCSDTDSDTSSLPSPLLLYPLIPYSLRPSSLLSMCSFVFSLFSSIVLLVDITHNGWLQNHQIPSHVSARFLVCVFVSICCAHALSCCTTLPCAFHSNYCPFILLVFFRSLTITQTPAAFCRVSEGS